MYNFLYQMRVLFFVVISLRVASVRSNDDLKENRTSIWYRKLYIHNILIICIYLPFMTYFDCYYKDTNFFELAWYKILYHHTVVIQTLRETSQYFVTYIEKLWRHITSHKVIHIFSVHHMPWVHLFSNQYLVFFNVVEMLDKNIIYTVYLYNNFVSGLVRFFVTASLLVASRLVVIRLQKTDSTWYKVLYKHTVYIICMYFNHTTRYFFDIQSSVSPKSEVL